MPKALYRGEWYIYHTRRREFAAYISASRRRDDPEGVYVRWVPTLKGVTSYKNPSTAQRWANRINHAMQLKRQGRPAKVVTVVTGEGARCLDRINTRDRGGSGTF